MSFHYSSATWRWYVEKAGQVVSEFYRTKAEAVRKAEEIGGKVRKTRW